MSKEGLKKVTSLVMEECLMSLKILAIKRKVSLCDYVRDVLEKHTTSKSKIVNLNEEV
jgi:hypothetical protein